MKKLPFNHDARKTSDACSINLEKFSEKMDSLDEMIHEAGGHRNPSREVEVIEDVFTHRELAYLLVMMKMQTIEDLIESKTRESSDDGDKEVNEFL